MSSPTIGVLALQGDFREHLTSLAELGVDTVAVRRVSELAKCDGLVVPGGESTTMIKLAANFNLLAPLRTKIAAGMPAFGTCAGMIMLADRITDGIAGQETLGGLDITVRRNAFGRQTESFETDLLLAADPDPFHAVFIRAPWVEQVGSQVAVLATAAIGDGGNKIVAVQQEQILATAFHPEVTGDLRIHQLFLDLVKQA